MSSVFDFEDYKQYLIKYIEGLTEDKRGFRSRLADQIGCQRTIVSQVLSGNYDFSVEHVPAINRLLKHLPDEADHFMLLLQYARAGNSELKIYFKEKIQQSKSRHNRLRTKGTNKNEITREQQLRYFSAWYYAAVHMLVSIDNFRTAEKISERLNLPPEVTNDVLNYLTEIHLLKKVGSGYLAGDGVMYFDDHDSYQMVQHNGNWRLKSLEALSRAKTLHKHHYSLLLTASEETLEKIYNIIIDATSKVHDQVEAKQKNEKLFCFNCDLFEV